MTEITIGANTYEVYQDVAEISVYADGMIGDQGDAWRAADATTQARAGVSSTRILNRLVWAGTLTDGYGPLAWPRSGLVYADGSPVDPSVIPTQVLDANSEIATALTAGLVIQPDPNAEATRILKAGSVMIEYFRTVDGQVLPLPLAVFQLIGLWLSGAGGALGLSIASGVCEKTSFDREYRPNIPS